jgi:uncharacterized membrane protein YgcG
MRIQKYLYLAIFLGLLSFTANAAFAAGQCKFCPPGWCVDKDAAAAEKAKKKAAAEADGLPKRLSKLFDQLPDCLRCVQTAPDWVHIVLKVNPDAWEKKYGTRPTFTSRSMAWSATNEYNARAHMKEGVLTEFHVTLGSTPCKCCPESEEGYVEWKKNGTLPPTSTTTGWNEELRIHDDTAIHFTDKDKLGESPKDLTEIPEGFKRPNSVSVPSISDIIEKPVRVVQASCKTCRENADAYNAIGEDINALNRGIAKNQRGIILLNKVIENVWLEMEGAGLVANTKETQKKQEDLMEELGQRQQQLDDEQRGLRAKKQKKIALEVKLKEAMDALKECEEKCTAKKETKNKVKVGDDVKKAPAEDKKEEGGFFSTFFGGITTSSSDSSANGSTGENPDDIDTSTLKFPTAITATPKGAPEAPKRITTSCAPCKSLVDQYNNALSRISYALYSIHNLKQRQDHFNDLVDGHKDQQSNRAGDANLESSARNLAALFDVTANLELMLKISRQRLEHARWEASMLAMQIQKCELQCTSEDGKTSITVGGFNPIGSIPQLPEPPTLGGKYQPNFPWKGPYTTDCWKCEKLAAELNRLPGLMEPLVRGIRNCIASIESSKAALRIQETGHFYKDRSDLQETVDHCEALIRENKANVKKIEKHFATVMRMLRECESSCKPSDSSSSGISIELEKAITVSGSNQFIPGDVKRIPEGGEGGSSGTVTGSSTSSSGVTTSSASGGVTTSSAGGSSASGSGASSGTIIVTPPPPPANDPLNVSTTGGPFSFAHTVGSSPCPQNAGTVTISSNNGNPLTVNAIVVTGNISSRINTATLSNNTAMPQIRSQFNCSSATNGSFSGNVTATVRDTITGEIENISIPISGTVSG